MPASGSCTRGGVHEKHRHDGTLLLREYREAHYGEIPGIEDIELVVTEEYDVYGIMYSRVYKVAYDSDEPHENDIRSTHFYPNGTIAKDEWTPGYEGVGEIVLPKPPDMPTLRRWHLNGQQALEEWRDQEYNLLHREGGPAYQEWYENGQPKEERWYLEGRVSRGDNKCAQSAWNEDGQLETQYWIVDGEEYRSDGGPVEVAWYPNGSPRSEYYVNSLGETHREDGPAVITWYEDGSIHTQEWFLGGKEYSTEEEWKEAVRPLIEAREAGFTDEMSKAWAGLE